jgi:hypothetical protein
MVWLLASLWYTRFLLLVFGGFLRFSSCITTRFRASDFQELCKIFTIHSVGGQVYHRHGVTILARSGSAIGHLAGGRSVVWGHPGAFSLGLESGRIGPERGCHMRGIAFADGAAALRDGKADRSAFLAPHIEAIREFFTETASS